MRPGTRNRTSRGPVDRRIAGVALGLALVLGACASKSAQVTYHDPNMDFSLVQTVAVLPFENLSGNTRAGDAVRDVFMTMLQATGSMYVLPRARSAAASIASRSVRPRHRPPSRSCSSRTSSAPTS